MNIINRNLSFGDMTYGNKVTAFVLHHIEAEGPNWTVENIHRMHIRDNKWSGIGYHYYIRLDGSVYKGRPDNAQGAHCPGMNDKSLGISFEGAYTRRTEMPSAQYNAGIELLKYLKGIYGNCPIFGHRDKYSTDCPGKYFPLDKFKAMTPGSGSSGNSNNGGTSSPVLGYGTVVNAPNGLRVRSSASTSGNILGTINNGERIKIGTKSGDWYNIFYGQNGGWVHSDYVKMDAKPETPSILGHGTVFNAPNGLRVRSSASTSSDVLGTLSNGEKVKIGTKSGDWLSIYYGQNGGWVHSDYVKLDSAPTPSVPEVDNSKYYVVTDYFKDSISGYTGVKLSDMNKYFDGVEAYVKPDSRGVWLETQYLDKAKADEIANKLKADGLFHNIVKE